MNGSADQHVSCQCSAAAYLSYFFMDCLMSRWYGVSPRETLPAILTGLLHIQAVVLYPSSNAGSAFGYECDDCMAYFLRAIFVWGVGGSAHASPGVGVYCYGKITMGVACSGSGVLTYRQTLTVLYHLTQRKINIRKETSASINVFSIASFISMSSLLLQLHLTRDNDPAVPLFMMLRKIWDFIQILCKIPPVE